MAKAIKTNVLRHLDAQKIPYETREYDVSDENYDGKLVADKVSLPAEMIYKTLVLTGDRSPVGSKSQYLVCVIPVEMELNLKAVARATGNKSVAMLPQKDLLPLTGYLRGGCSPIGMKKAFPTFIQQDAKVLDRISVSAGVRGCQVILAVDALVRCTGAKFAELCRE
ncbi:MAG: Cys-tRNA(Pro) deacylase [Clostridia bacterium]|nr:Cys-tRNA(Pro) deacylase [Clostridia bacterium]